MLQQPSPSSPAPPPGLPTPPPPPAPSPFLLSSASANSSSVPTHSHGPTGALSLHTTHDPALLVSALSHSHFFSEVSAPATPAPACSSSIPVHSLRSSEVAPFHTSPVLSHPQSVSPPASLLSGSRLPSFVPPLPLSCQLLSHTAPQAPPLSCPPLLK